MCDHSFEPGGREEAMVIVERDETGKPTVWCDPCLVNTIKALNTNELKTVASCCGHFNHAGWVMLEDGRTIDIWPNHDEHLRNGPNRLSTHRPVNVHCNCQPERDERLARLQKDVERDLLHDGMPRTYQHAQDVQALLKEVSRLRASIQEVLNIAATGGVNLDHDLPEVGGMWISRDDVVNALSEDGEPIISPIYADEWREELRRREQVEASLGNVLDGRTAQNIVNQIADYYAAGIPSGKWVEVRQASNDYLDDSTRQILTARAFGEES